MVTLTIDNRPVTVPEGTTILDAAKTVRHPYPNPLLSPGDQRGRRLPRVRRGGRGRGQAGRRLQHPGGGRHGGPHQHPAGPPGPQDQRGADPVPARGPLRDLRPQRQLLACRPCPTAMNIQEVPFRNEATERPWDKTLPILRD